MQRTMPTTEPFETGGGAPCIDFVNTLDGRLEAQQLERLTSYAVLVAFAEEVGCLADAESDILLQAAQRHPATASEVLQWAIELREALYRMLLARLDDAPPDADDLQLLNDALSDAGVHEKLEYQDERYRPTWATSDSGTTALDRPLWPIARSAALLLTGQLPGTLRACAAEDCAVLFLDTTRNQSRRWCSRAGCGNRARVRQFRQRQQTLSTGRNENARAADLKQEPRASNPVREGLKPSRG